jgi:hypothetical protein
LKKSARKKISKVSPAVEMAHSNLIREITGFDDQALRRLSAKGIIPRPKLSKWPLHETLTKLFAHKSAELAEKGSQLPVFVSMDACAGSGLLSKTFLQTLKNFGLPGFDNTRVDFNKLIPAIESFFAGTGESQEELQRESVSSFKEMKDKYYAFQARHDFRLSQGECITKATALESLRELLVIHHHSYGRMIEEWPTVLAGESAPKIRTHVTKAVEMLKSAEANSIAALEKVRSKPSAAKPSHD